MAGRIKTKIITKESLIALARITVQKVLVGKFPNRQERVLVAKVPKIINRCS